LCALKRYLTHSSTGHRPDERSLISVSNLLNNGVNCSPKRPLFSHILSRRHNELSTGLKKMFVSYW
jgi:hypothetical protein